MMSLRRIQRPLEPSNVQSIIEFDSEKAGFLAGILERLIANNRPQAEGHSEYVCTPDRVFVEDEFGAAPELVIFLVEIVVLWVVSNTYLKP
jgi:hypothetical protein